jgi:excinuclease ABC subunit B
MNKKRINEALALIEKEKKERIKYFQMQKKFIEAQRIEERVDHDVESIKELGYCNGIENYSRHLELRKKDETPYTIFDYFDDE